MKPYYEQDGITIYHGDCRDVMSCVSADVVVSDPPYGMKWPCDNRRFCGGSPDSKARRPKQPRFYPSVVGDDEPFDPAPWLLFTRTILWGANHFSQALPRGTTLVWIKRLEGAFGTFLSDAEIAWMSGGHGVYCFRDLSMQGETHWRQHPTQKPIPLMQWCLGFTSGTVLDPFMGSGSTLLAAKELGRCAIGIEIEERYCEIAANRLRQGVLTGMFLTPSEAEA